MIEKIVRDTTKHIFETKEKVVEKLNYYRKLSSHGLEKLSEIEISELKNDFNKFLNIDLAFFADTYPTKLFRVTNNKLLTNGKKLKLQNLTNLIGPPEGLSNIGRCNLNGESIFYSALDVSTAIWETQPDVDDYITVSEWKIKEGEHLNNHFIFHPEETNLSKESQNAYEAYLKANFGSNDDVKETFKELLKFICEEFMKPVSADHKINYLFSSIVSSRFLQRGKDSKGFQIESISYPSTKRDHEVTNIAILNSLVFQKLELVEVKIYWVSETNYDLKNKTREDLIKTSALVTEAKEFDFENNRILYDLKKELEDGMRLHAESEKLKNKGS